MTRALRLATLAMLCCASLARADIFDYLNNGDTSFAWEQTGDTEQYTTLAMTSQTWREITWKHGVTIFKPAQVRYPDACIVFITGGSFDPNDQEAMVGSLLARQLGVHFAVLWNIPNQPLFGGLTEDNLIAYTFDQYLKTGEGDWPVLFPMTKSAVRAMDALQAWSRDELGAPFSRFITSGASKRGWTTWFSGAVDDRVVGIMPMVYDNLNLPAQMRHQMELWGHYSPQISEYTERGLQDLLQTPAGAAFGALVDPYTLRERLAEPKLIINGTNDLYWTLDALNLYRDDLLGPVYQIYIPNSGHGLQDVVRVLSACGGFVHQVLGALPEPVFRWSQTLADGQVTLRVEAPTATKVDGWYAVADKAEFGTARWESKPATKQGDAWVVTVPMPATGALAVFGEATFDFAGTAAPRSTTITIHQK